LAGGTSLALQMGHRKSIDLDLFGKIESDVHSLHEQLNELGTLKILHQTDHIHVFLINDIKVDIVHYPYQWLTGAFVSDQIILAHTSDIAAMKLSAITGRGSKKDFIDIYFLLQIFSLKEMISFYNQKYPDGSEFLVLKSLSYFDDAEKEPSPVMLHKVSWAKIKAAILKSLHDYMTNIHP
jgi:hypothetical protein